MVVNTETQVDVRWETTSAVVPFVDGCGRPAGWLDSESDWMRLCLLPEMSPFVSVRSAAVPTFLPAMSEVFSLAVLAGGVVAEAAPLAVVGTVTARVSVLPDVGSEPPTDSDAAAVVRTALVDEVMDDALDVVGLGVGQSCLRMDSEDALPVLQDKRSMMSFLVRPVAVLISQVFLVVR